jgi:protein-disulfide isomerase
MSMLKPEVSSKDHIQGKKNAPIELVEFGDYECPYCGQAQPMIKRIQEELGDDLKFVFRNFPLTQVHAHAFNAAIATEIAASQGMFWEMHDILFENQNALYDDDILRYADEIGLDVDRFESDFRNAAFQEKVRADFESGIRSGVNGTPSFFVNGQLYADMINEQSLLAHLKALEHK